MSYQEEDFAKNETQLEHVESTDKVSPDHAQPHSSATLAAMPMSPSPALLAKAVNVAEEDKLMRPSSAFKMEWWGLLFCLAYLFPAMGQGFDNGAANIAVNMPAFLLKFGAFNPTTKSLYVPSLWLGLWNASTSLGNAIGSGITGAVTDRVGYRYAQLGGCVFSIGSIFLQVFAHNRLMLLFGKLLNGISMGMFVAISAGYISEVLGPRTRATAMSCLAATPIIGIIAGIAIGSTPSVIGNVTSEWGSWKLIFALQWVLPTIAIPLVLYAPESPTQLVKTGKPEVALKSLRRIRPMEDEAQDLVRLAGVQLSVAASIEEAQSQSDSYLECFKGVDRKRTFTVIALLSGAQFSGVSLLSNGLYFLSQTGIAFSTVSSISLAFLGLGCIFCITASYFLEKLGRRNTIIWGSLFHAAVMVLIGGLHYAQSKTGKIVTAILFNAAVSTAQFSTSAPSFALSIEISSVRLRSKTQSLGFMVYYVLGWIFLFTVPYMFQAAPAGAGWGTRACWFFAGLTVIFAAFSYFFVPETKQKSYADIDELYHRGISPRKFQSTEVNAERSAVA